LIASAAVARVPDPAPASSPSCGRLRLSLQRHFEVELDDGLVPVPHSSQRLVAFLAINEGPLPRDVVAAELWSDATGDRAAAALRTALWRLGSAMSRSLVVAGRGRLALRADVDVDFRATAQRAQAIIRDRGRAAARHDLATLRMAGDLLPDWYDDWVILERERFRQLRIDALETLCTALSADGHYASAIEAGLAALAAEPLREQSHRVLIAAHLAAGNPGEALRQYGILRRLLARELGVEPSPATDRLLAPLRAGDGVVTRAL
jgi:DNA-binding SARP family transcriptional activator